MDKPYDVQVYPNANAIVAAYGCKGSAVDPTEALIGGATGSAAAYGPNIIAAVEVILGTYAAQGKLPVNIPVLDMETRTYTNELAFERGFGLTYEAKEDTEHVYTWVVVEEATCTEPGLERGVCGHGLTAEREIPALGHNYVDGVCTNCGDKLMNFADVPEGEWYYEPVIWAVNNGVTTGMTDTIFAPDREATRAEVVTFLWRAAGEPVVESELSFPDVKETDFFYNAVIWAAEKNITNGKDNGLFDPYATCTRAEAVTFLWRYLDEPASSTTNSFTDVVPGMWYEAAINWAVEKGVTNGYADGIFNVDGACNRAHAVTFLYRALAK